METEIIDKLFLELAQVSSAKTAREIRLRNAITRALANIGDHVKCAEILKNALLQDNNHEH